MDTTPNYDYLLHKENLTINLQIPILLQYTLYTHPKMSNPNEGRQSPDPETQTGAQLHDPPSHGKLDDFSTRPTPEFSYEKSDQKGPTLNGSNPKHVLEDIEAEKFKK